MTLTSPCEPPARHPVTHPSQADDSHDTRYVPIRAIPCRGPKSVDTAIRGTPPMLIIISRKNQHSIIIRTNYPTIILRPFERNNYQNTKLIAGFRKQHAFGNNIHLIEEQDLAGCACCIAHPSTPILLSCLGPRFARLTTASDCRSVAGKNFLPRLCRSDTADTE